MANSRLTIRFYLVEKLQPQGLSLKQALKAIADLDFPDREQDLAAGLRVRLERFSEDSGELRGEVTRVRDVNYPFEVRTDGVSPLPTDGPIGDGVAFRFRQSDHTLAIQYDPRIVSPGRIMDYLMQCDGRGAFKITPKVDAENWKRFKKFPLKKLQVRIASPDHLDEVEDASEAVVSSLRSLGEAYSAPVITIEMGMGGRKGALGPAAKQFAASIYDRLGGGGTGSDLRALKGWSKTAEDEPVEEINLIDEILSDKNEIELPRNDPEKSYKTRDGFLKTGLARHGKRK